ncbi:MAG: hypothetical protein PVF57_01080 [Pseudomonadales bacterium]|jgi:hypothetical protein
MSRAKRKNSAGVSTPARQPKAPRKSEEPLSQVTIKMRESLHRELARKAFNSGMTMRGYIMRALRQAGLGITEADLVDRRRREGRH